MAENERLSKSVSLLAQRVDLVAAEVERSLSEPIDPWHGPSARRCISTGVGASEGPARLLATLLRARGASADFAPISTFALEAPDAPEADVCVVVSQRLSPNARMPLARARGYARKLLVTTLDDAPDLHEMGVRLVRHGPSEEDGLLLRVVGPAAANAKVMRLASHLLDARDVDAGVSAVSDALASAPERARRAFAGIDPHALVETTGLVAVGMDTALCDGLRHKLLEGFGRTHTPLWDLCSLVHGPLQSFYESRATLVLFERDTTPSDLTRRLAEVLHPARHHLVRLRSALPGPLALLDFDLQLDHLLIAALQAKPRDLVEWPGKGCDAPLYDLGRASLGE